MKIVRNSKVIFSCPTALLANVATIALIRTILKRAGLPISIKQTIMLMREMRKYKKSHPDWNLAEIEQKNGDIITIDV